MGIIIGLISISLIIAIGFLISFIWSMKSGQYDDTYSPSVRILFDEKPKVKPKTKSENKNDETSRYDIAPEKV